MNFSGGMSAAARGGGGGSLNLRKRVHGSALDDLSLLCRNIVTLQLIQTFILVASVNKSLVLLTDWNLISSPLEGSVQLDAITSQLLA